MGRKGDERVISEEDILQKEATEAARAAMVAVLKDVIDGSPTFPVRGLSKEDLTKAAEACVTGWILKRAEQAHALGIRTSSLDKFIRAEFTPADDGIDDPIDDVFG